MAVDADTSQEPMTRTAEDSPAGADGAEDGSQPTAVRVAFAVVLVMLAALVGLGVWLGQQFVSDRHAEAQRQLLVGVGRQAALNLTTIDFTTVDADIKRILDSSVGTFHDDFEKRSEPFVQAVTEAQSKSVGTVTEAGLESRDGDDAQVLVAVAVKTTAAGVEDQQPRAWRMRITVTQPAGQDPKVSNVQFVP